MPDSTFSLTDKFLKPYRQKLTDSFSAIIGKTNERLVKQKPAGSLGNLLSCAMYEKSKTLQNTNKNTPAVVITNYGGIRIKEIAKGNISIGKIFELMPFENTLVRIDIKGSVLVQFIEQINKRGGWPMYWDQQKISSLQKLKRCPLVHLYTNNYIAQGGDQCSILKTLPQEDTQILLRNILIEYIIKEKNITPDQTKRILQ